MIKCVVAIALSIFSVSVWAEYEVRLMPNTGYFEQKYFSTLADATTYLHSYGYLSSFLTPTKTDNGLTLYTLPKDSMDFNGKAVITTYSQGESPDPTDPTSAEDELKSTFCAPNSGFTCYSIKQETAWQLSRIFIPSFENPPDQSWINFTSTYSVVAGPSNEPQPKPQEVTMYKHQEWDCRPPKPDLLKTQDGGELVPIYTSKSPGVCTLYTEANISGVVVTYKNFIGTAYVKYVGTPSCSHAGDPVDLTNGNVYLHTTDLVVRGPFPIRIQRFYNSKSGWTFSYTSHVLNMVGDGTSDQNGPYIYLSTEQGNTFQFDGQGDATDGAQGTLENQTWADFYTAPDSTKYEYDAPQQDWQFGDVGKLTEITNPQGLTQSVAYQDGEIDSVSDTFGHKVVITSHDGKFDSVTDPNGNTIHYTYDQNGNLTQVTWPSGKTVYYQYGDSAHPNLLTAVLDSNKKVVSSWTYDSDGRAITNTQEQ